MLCPASYCLLLLVEGTGYRVQGRGTTVWPLMCGIHQRFLRQVLQLLGWHANKMICSWCWCNTVHVRREVIHMLLNGWSQPSRKSLCHAVRNPYAYHSSCHVQSPWWQWGVVLSMVKLPRLVSLLVASTICQHQLQFEKKCIHHELLCDCYPTPGL